MGELCSEKIEELISRGFEGSYWDYKREWYGTDEKGKSDMLHDIICMANNPTNFDGYIIIGVGDNGEVVGIEEGAHRRNTQMIVDFLGKKPFAGSVRPSAYVDTVMIRNHSVDIIVVENTSNTPFYLTADEGKLHANYIYTREFDTNTPKDRSADPHRVEQLWRKRFRIDVPPLEKMKQYLQDTDGWKQSPVDGFDIQYYEKAPEYTMTAEWDESRTGCEIFLLETAVGIPDKMEHINFRYTEIVLKYHQTVLYEDLIVGIDNNHMQVIVPERAYFRDSDVSYVMFYLVKDSLPYLINLHYCESGLSDYYFYDKYFREIIVFENEEELDAFKAYMNNRMGGFKEQIEKANEEVNACITDITEEAIEQFKGALLIKRYYREWLKEQGNGDVV